MEFSAKNAKSLYKSLYLPRAVEERMLIALRQGRISKWFSSYGQEAVSVATAMAMHEDEWICTMHRNLGVFTSRSVPLKKLFAQFQGKYTGFTKGRDRSFHFGSIEHRIFGMISHLGPQLGVADGLALGRKLRGEKKCVLVYTGDGGASEGDFHEALNVAAVWNLPVLIVVENNQWGLSTPSKEQFVFDSFTVKGPAYGMEAHSVDGNDFEAVYTRSKSLTESIRENPRPILLECVTFRVRGHEEASGTKYYPEGLQDEWEKRDPVVNFEVFLKSKGILTDEHDESLKSQLKNDIQVAFDHANDQSDIIPNVANELTDVYASHLFTPTNAGETTEEIRFIDAIQNGLRQSLERFPSLIIMGQDIAEYGGAFKVTEGFVDEFGKERIRNTPLCESAILGAGLGLSIAGMKAVVEMQFADFVTCGFNQIINNLAKIHWRWGQNADVVVRMPTGAGAAAGPFHSQSNEAWFFHTPGLKIVYPSNPFDAKGLLNAAIEDPNPVLFFEHKMLYRSVKGNVPTDYYTLEIGKANVVNEGKDVTIISYGAGVNWALEAMESFPENSAEIVDLRTLLPLDTETIYKAAKKTGRVIVLHEDCLMGGIGGEISALIMENCFEFLDAPVSRVGSMDTPVPFAADLEKQFLPQERFLKAIEAILAY